MPLSNILNRKAVIIDLEARDRFDAIEKLINVLSGSGGISADKKPLVLSEVIEREKLMATGMDHGVAVPHAMIAGIDEEIAAFARAKGPVDFKAHDGKPSDLIFLLLIPQDPVIPHVRTLSRIVRLLGSEEIRRFIRRADTAEEIYEVFC
ncbi:MAG: PTS sugar transporter subunit IIA [FCB group bacterium]|nr:PTS sugar transporter subunit IIA [FCB group bacterium]